MRLKIKSRINGALIPVKKEPSDFKDFIQKYKERVYDQLTSYLPKGEPEEFIKMIRSYVDRKGQYRRPSYVLLWNLLYGGKEDQAILPAAIQQASEDYFLMHDDWMDNNKLRRGLPSAHIMFGPVYAILAGDVINNIIWKMAYDASNMMKEREGKRYFAKVYDLMLTTHTGQYYDVHLTSDLKDITKFSLDDYYKAIHAKSAYYSVYGPMQCGAIVAGASDNEIERIPEYGTPVGMAFQIKDDILDCTSEESVFGKTSGNDVYEGVKTIILWHTVQNASSNKLEKIKSIYLKPRDSKTKEEIRFVLDAFNEYGSIKYAEEQAEKFIKDALKHFEIVSKNILESPIKELARNSIGYVTKRNK